MIKFIIVGAASLVTGFLGHLAISKSNTPEKKAVRASKKDERASKKATKKAEKVTPVVAEPVIEEPVVA